jgi:DNA (cytosine-5)-methyltransferase 1
MKLISLFSGIGGFELAASWMGWTPIVTCEIEEFPNKILNYYWPNAYHHKDVKTLTYETINDELTRRWGKEWRDDKIILTGGFPCQPYSAAGQRKGKEDERHLWPEMLRLIQEIAPDWIVGENVLGLTNWNGGVVFEEVCVDLEDKGYEVQPYILPASSKNAPHKRDRVWFVAYSNSNGYIKSVRGGDGEKEKISREHRQKNSTTREFIGTNKWNVAHSDNKGRSARHREVQEEDGKVSKWNDNAEFSNSSNGNVTNSNSQRQEWERKQGVTTEERKGGEKRFEQLGYNEHQWEKFPTQPPVCGGDDGISTELDGITFPKWRRESIKGYGNAIVPQVVYSIFKTIEKYESTIKES